MTVGAVGLARYGGGGRGAAAPGPVPPGRMHDPCVASGGVPVGPVQEGCRRAEVTYRYAVT